MKKFVLTDRAKADLAALDRPTGLGIAAAIQRLVLSNVGNIKKLQGVDPPEYRLRVGDWRVRFSRPDANTVRINHVQNRKDAYRSATVCGDGRGVSRAGLPGLTMHSSELDLASR